MTKYLRCILILLLIAAFCIFAVLIYNDKITQNSPVYYRNGVKFYNEGNYADAYYNFSKINRISPLYPAALYKQAKSAQKKGDYKTAALKYNLYLQRQPDGLFARSARLNLAKSWYYLKQYENAEKEFAALAEKSNNDGAAEIFFLGLTVKNYAKDRAADYFRKYLNAALKDKTADNNYTSAAALELAMLEEKSDAKLSLSDIKLIAKTYFRDYKYKEALKYFSMLPKQECFDYLILADYYINGRKKTEKFIENMTSSALNDFKNLRNAEIENLYKIYGIYTAAAKDKHKSLLKLKKAAEENGLKGIDYILFKLAETSKKDKAAEYYNELHQNYPNSKYAAEALYNAVYDAYKSGAYNKAQNLAVKHLKTYLKVNSTPKTAFWLAKAYLKQNKISEARSILSRLTVKYPDNYYGLRAASLLENNKGFWISQPENRLPEKNTDIEFPVFKTNIELKNLKIINDLFNMNDYEVWLDADFVSPYVLSWFEYKKGNKSKSMVLARDELLKTSEKPYISSSEYKLAYPVYAAANINAAAEKLNIDSYLIIAVMREESYFNKNAKSTSGAIGLMQLMPKTAAFMIKKLNAGYIPLENLEDADINLYLGSNYLKYLKNRFDNDLLVIAAYNGGEGAVSGWLKKNNTNDLDEFIEDIPFDETRNYVKKVFRTYHMYKKIYNGIR